MNLLAAAACGDLMPRDGLRKEHRRLEVDCVHPVECFLGHAADRLLDLRADAIDQDVDGAVARGERVDHALDVAQIDGIHRRCIRAVTGSPELARKRGCFGGAPSRDQHRRAVPRKGPGDRLADAAIAARQQRDPAFEVEHSRELFAEVDARRDRRGCLLASRPRARGLHASSSAPRYRAARGSRASAGRSGAVVIPPSATNRNRSQTSRKMSRW